MGSFSSKLEDQFDEKLCGHPLDSPFWPSDVPQAVSEFWSKTECPALTKENFNPPPTITVPEPVNDWWVATGNAFFATKVPGINLPSVIPEPGSSTAPPLPSNTPSPPAPSNSGNRQGPVQATPKTPTSTTAQSISSSTEPSTSSSSTTGTMFSGTTVSSNFGFMSGTDFRPASPTDTNQSSPPSNISTSTASPSALATKPKNKTIPIVVGVVVPLVLITLGVAAFILYKRRQRARDRREWERTHEAIADAVRQVGAPAAAGLPAWNPARGDMKEPLDGDTSPLFDKSGRSYPGV